MVEENYYELLRVDANCTEQQLKTSYRSLAKQYHPDKNPNGLEEFKKIDKAYRVLIDKEKRRLYDAGGDKYVWETFDDDGPEFTLADLEAILKSHVPTKKADPIKKDLEIELEDAYNGALKDIQVSVNVPCSFCYGLFLNKRCSRCRGQMKNVAKTVKVEIKKGVVNNQEITFIGEGNHQEDRLPGDLIFVVIVKSHYLYHPYGFNDLMCSVTLSKNEARRGFSKILPSLDGRHLRLNYKRGPVKDGCRMMVEDEGMPDYFDNHRKGRLFVTFSITDCEDSLHVAGSNYQQVGVFKNLELIPLDDFENLRDNRRLVCGLRRTYVILIFIFILSLILMAIIIPLSVPKH